jgi:hypothetical protein
MQTSSSHRWKFYRCGGVDQVALRDAADLRNLKHLDLKLWMALAMPTRGIEFDPLTADLLDTDKDGRIRPPEVLAAIDWADAVLEDLGTLLSPGDELALAEIKDPGIRAGALRVLNDLEMQGNESISLADLSARVSAFVNTRLNGDGVIIPDSSDDPKLQQAIIDLIQATGGTADRSGKAGINAASIDQFNEAAARVLSWREQLAGYEREGNVERTIAEAALQALNEVKPKIDDFFARCRLLTFDSRPKDTLNPDAALYGTIAGKSLSFGLDELESMPLAFVAVEKPLPLSSGVNPAWSTRIRAFVEKAVVPVIGKEIDTLSEAQWLEILKKIAPFKSLVMGKPVDPAAAFDVARLQALLDAELQASLRALMEQDAALEDEYNQLSAVEKLLRFKKDMRELLLNFVNFADFYGKTWAVFQAGELFLDARSCSLCIEVTDAGKHATLAGLSAAYLAYCDITRKGQDKRTIVAVFTDGDSDNLIVGRNGVFYDRKGNDWDATVTKIVANPISIREAFLLPYKKLVRMVEEQIAKRAQEAEASSNAKLVDVSATVANADKTVATPPAATKKLDLGTIALIGTAVGGVSALVGAAFSALFSLGIWVPVGLFGLLMLISGPSMLLAWMKLRQRNLGPILDANGWAINAKAKMNVPFGAALTHLAHLPAGAERSLTDPYADKKTPWRRYLTLILLVVVGWAWFGGKLDRWLPESVSADKVLGRSVPAAVEVAPADPAAAPAE